MADRVQRLDLLGKIPKVKKTSQGGIATTANLTRTGVFTYQMSDGSTFRELRHPDEVFNPESLASLEGAPLTLGHPGKVDAANWRSSAVGHVGESVKPAGIFVKAKVRVDEAEAVKKIEAGELVELSCGYDCETEVQAGEYNGEKYDGIQRNIRYNHVGLGPRGWGRAGSEVGLHLDGGYATGMALESTETPVVPVTPAPVVNVVNHVDHAEIERLKGTNAALEAEIARVKAEAAPSHIDAKVASRLALQDKARKVLGTEAKFDGKTDLEIMLECVKAGEPSLKVDGKAPAYVEGMFDTVSARYAASEASAAKVREDANATTADGQKNPIHDAQIKMIERNLTAWKGKAK